MATITSVNAYSHVVNNRIRDARRERVYYPGKLRIAVYRLARHFGVNLWLQSFRLGYFGVMLGDKLILFADMDDNRKKNVRRQTAWAIRRVRARLLTLPVASR